MPPKQRKRASNYPNSAPKRLRSNTASQPIAIDSEPSAPTPLPPYIHFFESRFRKSQPEDAIAASAVPADNSSEQATLALSSEVSSVTEACEDEEFDSHLEDNFDGIELESS